MLGTFAGALDVRKINGKDGRLTAEVRGEVEEDNKVLVIRRVHVSFRVRAASPDEIRETVDGVHSVYLEGCPVYRSLKAAFQITSDVEVRPEDIAGS